MVFSNSFGKEAQRRWWRARLGDVKARWPGCWGRRLRDKDVRLPSGEEIVSRAFS